MKFAVIIVFMATSTLFAQESGIRDNSFLVEEAFNQEPGEMQHIFNFIFGLHNEDIEAAHTTEFSLYRKQLQGAVSGSFSNDQVTLSESVVGLHLRYQFLDDPSFASAFRLAGLTDLSIKDEFEFQSNLSMSIPIALRWIVHANVGLTYVDFGNASIVDAFGSGNYRRSDYQWNHTAGGSAIYALDQNFHLMIEYVFNRSIDYSSGYSTSRFTTDTGIINPGFRYAINLISGSQWVIGAGVPIGVMESNRDDRQLFIYLSFEH